MESTRTINSTQLIKELKGGSLLRIYLFAGEEEGEKEKAISSLVSLLGSKSAGGRVITGRYHLENGELMQGMEFALSMSMFDPAKLCVLMNIDALGSSESSKGHIREIVASLPDTTTLVMTTLENRFPSVIPVELRSRITLVNFWKRFESDLQRYISTSLRQKKISIHPRAVNLLIDLLGRDVARIDDAIEKLENSGLSSIDEAIIRDAIHFERDVNVFEFVDMLFRKDRRALAFLARLVEEGVHELVILTMITREAEALERYHRLCRNADPSSAMDELKIPEKKRESFLAHAAKYPPADTVSLFPLILECESAIKDRLLSKNLVSNPVFILAGAMLARHGISPSAYSS